MAVTPAFKIGFKIALEGSRGDTPDYTTNPMWWQGGKWVDVTTDGLATIQDRQAIIFAAGHAGRRMMNNRAPVLGRHWSDGGFAFPVTEDFLGVILYAALGSGSVNSVPGGDPSLLETEPIEGGSLKQLVLGNQPADGGNIIEFVIYGASAGGYISVSGIDSDGQGASETISFSSAGSFYTRTSFSAIGASGVEISGSHGGASVSVHGYQYWDYIFSVNNTSAPTLSMERLGDPTAGAASKSHLHSGMVIGEFTLNTPADQRDGLFTGNTTVEGDPASIINSTSLNAVSAVGVWPAWGLAITRDGVNWHKVLNQSITLNTGGRNYRAAAGTRSPQGSFWGAIESTGTFDILVDDEEEFNRWKGASSHALVFDWTTPHKLTSSQNQKLTASALSAYLEDISLGESDDALTLSADYRTIDDANAGLIRFQLICGVPPTAFNL